MRWLVSISLLDSMPSFTSLKTFTICRNNCITCNCDHGDMTRDVILTDFADDALTCATTSSTCEPSNLCLVTVLNCFVLFCRILR